MPGTCCSTSDRWWKLIKLHCRTEWYASLSLFFICSLSNCHLPPSPQPPTVHPYLWRGWVMGTKPLSSVWYQAPCCKLLSIYMRRSSSLISSQWKWNAPKLVPTNISWDQMICCIVLTSRDLPVTANYLKTEPGEFYVNRLEFLSPLNFCCQAQMSVSQTGLSASQFSGDVSM